MFNVKYIKVEPTTFLMQFKYGKLKRKGKGLSFFYFAPTTSLVAIPVGTTDLPFMLKETTKDYQEVTLQGQVVYRIADPEKTAGLMNFTLKPDAQGYSSEDPEKLRNRIVNLVQVKMRTAIEQLDLRQAINASQALVQAVKNELVNSDVLDSLGIEIMDLSILAIKPTPETARALEASVREQLLEEADQAIYRRRNASIDQERSVKENELNTELAIEAKQQEIEERKIEAERQMQEKQNEIVREQLEADVVLEQQRQELVELASVNGRKEADVKAYEIATTMEALSKIDAKVLEAMTMGNLQPEQLLAQAFRELAGGAERIGQLNISPDLLQQLSGRQAMMGGAR
ncbi:MAG: SPFH domain-containing protein [Ketobacter sp.]|nr:SPFH domain-containing protein [Ketobacter sp.]